MTFYLYFLHLKERLCICKGASVFPLPATDFTVTLRIYFLKGRTAGYLLLLLPKVWLAIGCGRKLPLTNKCDMTDRAWHFDESCYDRL